jgi:hypothetical protein
LCLQNPTRDEGERPLVKVRWIGLFAALSLAPLILGGCHWGLVGVMLLGGTAPLPYHAESLAKELGPQSVRTLGCLDVGVVVFDRLADSNPSSNSTFTHEMLDFHVGNRCSYPEAIDLRKLVIRGERTVPAHWAEIDPANRDHVGKIDIALWDPRSEIRELSVGGSERGRERIRLDGAHSAERICFNFERIAPDAPEARPAEMCFVRKGYAWEAG